MTEYIVRDSWDTGHEDHSGFSTLNAARMFQRRKIKKLIERDGVDPAVAKHFVRIYILAEVV